MFPLSIFLPISLCVDCCVLLVLVVGACHRCRGAPLLHSTSTSLSPSSSSVIVSCPILQHLLLTINAKLIRPIVLLDCLRQQQGRRWRRWRLSYHWRRWQCHRRTIDASTRGAPLLPRPSNSNSRSCHPLRRHLVLPPFKWLIVLSDRRGQIVVDAIIASRIAVALLPSPRPHLPPHPPHRTQGGRRRPKEEQFLAAIVSASLQRHRRGA